MSRTICRNKGGRTPDIQMPYHCIIYIRGGEKVSWRIFINIIWWIGNKVGILLLLNLKAARRKGCCGIGTTYYRDFICFHINIWYFSYYS